MRPGERRQASHESDQAGGVPDLRVPSQLELTPSQMTALVVIEYGSDEQGEDARLEAALRRVRGRPDQNEARRIYSLATGILAAAFLALEDEGSISMEMGRQKKLGLLPAGSVMIAKRNETSFAPGSLERELSNQVGSQPQRAYELFRSWLSPSPDPAKDVVRVVVASIGSPETLAQKIDEARPSLVIWCEQLGGSLTTELGRRLRVEAIGAMRSKMSKHTDTIDTSFAWS